MLQEELKKFIVEEYKKGRLKNLQEAQLRIAAFNSHPKAYTMGGLTMVALTAPEMIIEIGSIPKMEFLPTSDNFQPSVKQVLDTIEILVPQAVGIGLAALAGPVHNGILKKAMQNQQNAFNQEIRLGKYLNQLNSAIKNGNINVISTLDEIINRINAIQFPDQNMARFAREIVEAANQRKKMIVNQYQNEINKDETLRPMYNQFFPGWAQ